MLDANLAHAPRTIAPGSIVRLPDGEIGEVTSTDGDRAVVHQRQKALGAGPWEYRVAQVQPASVADAIVYSVGRIVDARRRVVVSL